MPSLFHQNMRVFGGGSAARNAQFNASFGQMQAMVGNVLAAGFTEITNSGAPLRGQLLALSGVLNANLTNVLVVEVGTSALGLTEYIGMTWDPQNFTVTHAGQVVYNNLTRGWNTYVRQQPLGAVLRIPGGQFDALDSRGPAFLAGQLNNSNAIVMFMHNMFNLGDRTTGFSGLQNCAQAIMMGTGYGAARVYVGGDFNVSPRNLRKRRGGMPLLDFRAATAANGALIPTTVQNCYDFWLLSNPAAVNQAFVLPQSRVALASDHAAILINI